MWIMDDPANEADTLAEGETLEMRDWNGRSCYLDHTHTNEDEAV